MNRVVCICVLLACAACAEEVEPPADRTPPITTVVALPPTGAPLRFFDGELVTNVLDVVVQIDADEPAIIYFTTDGSDPRPGGASTGIGRNRLSVPLTMDTVVRWLAIDLAGNEAFGQRAELRFDRDAPQIRLDPQGGIFDGPVNVEIATDEPATLFWSTNGVSPSPGTPHTQSAPAPVTLQFESNATLRVLARDAVGNSSETGAVVFEIDDEAPNSMARPAEGHYVSPLEVDLVSDDPRAVVRFTTDGTDPGPDSPVWEGPRRVEDRLELRFRAEDPGGNTEAVREATYIIGPRAVGPATVGGEGLTFPVEGGLWLAAALIEASGHLSGGDGPGFGRDWTAWAVGRSAVDAVVFQSGVGIHALRGPGFAAQAGAADARDENRNGTELDDAWAARVTLLAADAGAEVPAGLFPVALFYAGARSGLLRGVDPANTDDGRPAWDDDFAMVRWEGARAVDRVVTPGATAAGLRALAARGRAATISPHAVAPEAYRSAAPTLGLRCGGCHREEGVLPRLRLAGDFAAAGEVVPGDPDASPILGRLSGDTPHHNARATPAQVARVRAWIAAGAEVAGEELAVGTSGREGLLGLLAIETAAQALAWIDAEQFFDPETRRLAGADTGRYLIARASATEAAVPDPALPRSLQGLRPETALFDTRGHLRMIRALHAVSALDAVRRPLFASGPLAGDDRVDTAPSAARGLQPLLVDAVETWGQRPGGGYVGSSTPGIEGDETLDALATADALVALRLTGAGAEASAAARALRALLDVRGDVATERDAAGLSAGRPLLSVQMAALHALLVDGMAGSDSSMDAARALWDRLEARWWDAGAGMWQTVLGLPSYAWSPDLAARSVDAVHLGIVAGLPNAEARLQSLFDRVIFGGLLVAETWLSGELSHDRDGDGDGVAGIGAVDPDGAAPVFYRVVTF